MKSENSQRRTQLIFRSAKWFNRSNRKVMRALLVTFGNKSHSDHVALFFPFTSSFEKRTPGEREKKKKTSEHPPNALESRITTQPHSLNHPFNQVSSFCYVILTKAQPVTIMTMIIIRVRHRGKEHSRRNLASITLIIPHPGYRMPFTMTRVLTSRKRLFNRY